MAASKTPIALYGYYTSSCTARLRIALRYKEIAHSLEFTDLDNKEHHSAAYRSLNPSSSVPTLVHDGAGPHGSDLVIGQSVAALEYLDEAFPQTRALLPPVTEAAARAKIRQLVGIIASDTQPQTGSRVPSVVSEFAPGADIGKWKRKFTELGIGAFEKVAQPSAGTYSYGDELTMADVMLGPACWNALLSDVDLTQFPTVNRVFGNLMKLDVFQNSHYCCQPDTPEHLKESLRKKAWP